MDPKHEQLMIYKALLAATTSLAQGSTSHEVLRSACDALVASSRHICLAWMYLGNPEGEAIRPSYSVGRASEYAAQLVIDRTPDSMKGPGRRSLAANKPIVVKVDTDASFSIWRSRAEKFGLKEGLTLPIGNPESLQRGLIVIFTDVPDYFDQVGIDPFIAFAQLAGVALDQAKMKIRLEEMATIDPTTGLFNRRALQEIVHREHERAKRGGRPYSLLLIDLDRFKLINDNYGHKIGDEILAGFSGVGKRALRTGDWIGRWGGEEFLAVLPEAEEKDALVIAERVRRNMDQFAVLLNGQRINATVSIGVSCYPRDGETSEFLIKAADAALYEAKKTGRNRIVAATGKQEVYSIAAKIRSAIAAGRLRPAYQPIVDLQTRTCVAEESLARLIDEDGMVLEAGQFISAATELQLTHLVDFEIIRQTMSRCAGNFTAGGRGMTHFVNLSGDLLMHQELIGRLFEEARQLCLQCGLGESGAKPMVIEITERQLLGDMQAVRTKLAPFLDFGMRLAVDDFGSGYSSFRYLAELPVSFLKIEGSLITQIGESRIRQIVRRIADIAKDLGLTTIAEYVESEETAEILLDLGIDWAQGYHFGRPAMPGHA